MEEDKNYINLIRGDLTKASQAHNGMPDSVGMMNIKTANQTILEASLLPTPRALWDSFWYEGELSCLFADSNVGKSILAGRPTARFSSLTILPTCVAPWRKAMPQDG